MKIPRNMPQIGKPERKVLEPVNDHVDDPVLLLHESRGDQGPRPPRDPAETQPDLRADDQVDGARFHLRAS